SQPGHKLAREALAEIVRRHRVPLGHQPDFVRMARSVTHALHRVARHYRTGASILETLRVRHEQAERGREDSQHPVSTDRTERSESLEPDGRPTMMPPPDVLPVIDRREDMLTRFQRLVNCLVGDQIDYGQRDLQRYGAYFDGQPDLFEETLAFVD